MPRPALPTLLLLAALLTPPLRAAAPGDVMEIAPIAQPALAERPVTPAMLVTEQSSASGATFRIRRPLDTGAYPAIILPPSLHSPEILPDAFLDPLEDALNRRGVVTLRIFLQTPAQQRQQHVPARFDSIHGLFGDTVTAYNLLARSPFVQPARIGILGLGGGATIAAMMCASVPGKFRLIALVAPSFDLPSILPPVPLALSGPQPAEFSANLAGEQARITPAFLASLDASRPLSEISKYTGPLLLDITAPSPPADATRDAFLAATLSATRRDILRFPPTRTPADLLPDLLRWLTENL